MMDNKTLSLMSSTSGTINQSINQQLNNLPAPIEEKPIVKKPTLEEKLLDHINNVHLNLIKRLDMAERKIIEIENENGLVRSDFDSLKEDLVQFKDTAKDLYRDIQNINSFTMI